MAKNVTINGQNYSAVPSVEIPITGGGTASFVDISDTTATAADVNSGKYLYLANGSKVQGSQTMRTITKNLTKITVSNLETKILNGNSLYLELLPDDGYLISSVTVTMGGVDVTSQVFSGGIGQKAITVNGIYEAEDDNLSGYSIVNVNVPSSAVVGTKSISANGTYTASNDSLDGYSSVNVSVPNTYSSSDEGKVVSSGALVSQGSQTVNSNNTYDTTLINSLTVSVPTSGGYTLLGSGTYTRTSGTNLSIPVTYNGTPKIALLRVNTPTASTNQGYLVQRYFVTSDEAGYGLLSNTGMAYAVGLKSDGTYAGVAYNPSNVTLSATTLGVSRISSTYPWQNTTYDWYIYGNA